jgi:predicted RNA polymerase sigma factor
MAKVSTAITGFENFAAREYPRLVAALTLLVRDRGVAEELAQDALVRTYERWGRVREMSAPGTLGPPGCGQWRGLVAA